MRVKRLPSEGVIASVPPMKSPCFTEERKQRASSRGLDAPADTPIHDFLCLLMSADWLIATTTAHGFVKWLFPLAYYGAVLSSLLSRQREDTHYHGTKGQTRGTERPVRRLLHGV